MILLHYLHLDFIETELRISNFSKDASGKASWNLRSTDQSHQIVNSEMFIAFQVSLLQTPGIETPTSYRRSQAILKIFYFLFDLH